MGKKAVSITVIITLMSMLSGAQFTSLSSANFFPDPGPDLPRIYIRSNGDIEPETAPIKREGNIYKLTDNIHLQTIVIQRDNIVLDGSGYLIEGNKSWLGGTAQIFRDTGNNAIIIVGQNNINITNLRIEKYTTSTRIADCSNINIVNNIFADGAHAMDRATVIVLEDCSYVTVEHNGFTSTNGPAAAVRGTNITIRENTLTDVLDGIDGCIYLEGPSNTISDNTIKASSHIKLNNANLCTVARNNLSGSGEGIFLSSQCSTNQIIANNLTGYRTALRIMVGHNNTVYGNTFWSNEFAVELSGWGSPTSANNTFYGNTFTADSCKIRIHDVEGTLWDNGAVGNYWGNYNGSDSNGDDIGDTPYTITGYKWNNDIMGDVSFPAGEDNYPLMQPYEGIKPGTDVLPKADSSLFILLVSAALSLTAIIVSLGLIVHFRKSRA